MSIKLKISGMSCMHCVASVKSALEAVEGVTGVEVSLENGSADIECSDSVKKEALVSAIEDIGFAAE